MADAILNTTFIIQIICFPILFYLVIKQKMDKRKALEAFTRINETMAAIQEGIEIEHKTLESKLTLKLTSYQRALMTNPSPASYQNQTCCPMCKRIFSP